MQKPKTLNTLIININKNSNIIGIISINNMKPTKFIGKTKVTKQGQVTLPFEARQDLGIPLESEVYWYEVNNCLVVVKDLVNQKELLNAVINNKRGKK